jgi:hypothetical protein
VSLGSRIATGTRLLAAQLRAWLAAGDLTTEKGLPLAGAALMKARAGRVLGAFVLAWFVGGILLALGVIAVGDILLAASLIFWGALALWVLAALVASAGMEQPRPEPEEQAEPERPVEPAGPAYHAERLLLLEALDEITAHTGNIHLMHLWEQLRTRRPYADLGDKQLRALLVHYGVPIHQSVTANRVKGRSGVKRTDIEALCRPTPPPLSTAPLGEEELTDQQGSSSSFPTRKGPEGDDDLGDDTLAMLRGEVSTR